MPSRPSDPGSPEPLLRALVDAYVPGVPGGTGTAIDDPLLDAPTPLPRLILAGGLTPANVAERVARVRPWMVDVASGVESSPGRKDPAAVAAFTRCASSTSLESSGSDEANQASTLLGPPARIFSQARGAVSRRASELSVHDNPVRSFTRTGRSSTAASRRVRSSGPARRPS